MDNFPYIGLFLSAFVAATLFPAQSELALSGLLLAGKQPAGALIAVATVGNTLGSLVNWLLGRYFYRCKDKRWFPCRGKSLDKAAAWYRKYGRWSLLLSWMPIIGDPITLAAGVLREPFFSFIILVALAKFGRYMAIAAVLP